MTNGFLIALVLSVVGGSSPGELRVLPLDSLTLAQCRAAAERHFPLMRRSELAAEIAALEARNVDAAYRPSVSVDGQAVYHSAVPELPFEVPGADVPDVPHDQYAVSLNVVQRIYDGGTRRLRRDLSVAGAELVEREVDAALHELLTKVDDAYFGAMMQRTAEAGYSSLIDELRVRRQAMAAQVDDGLADAGVLDVLDAEMLRAEQERKGARARRRSALDALEVLTGLAIDDEVQLILPQIDVEPPGAAGIDRPEQHVFAVQRERLALQRQLTVRRLRPTLSSAASAAYGRPAGLDIFETELSPFFSAGLRLSWPLWDGRTARREQQVLALHQEEVQAREAAFTQGVRAAAASAWREVERLEALLRDDARILELRRRIAERAADRLQGGVITATEYVVEQHAVQSAAVALERHRIELEHARIRYATTLGRVE